MNNWKTKGSATRRGIVFFLLLLGLTTGTVWSAEKEKIDLLVFKNGEALEAVVLKEDRQNYYVRLREGTTSFEKNSIRLVRQDIREGFSEPRRNLFSDLTHFAESLKKKPAQKKKDNAFMQKQMEWEKAQAQMIRQGAAPALPPVANDSAPSEDGVSSLMETRAYFGSCPFRKQQSE